MAETRDGRGDAVYVRSISALGGMHQQLVCARQATQAALQSLAKEIDAVCKWLEERLRHWRGVVERCRAEVEVAKESARRAESQMRSCLAQPPKRGPRGEEIRPDCSLQIVVFEQACADLTSAQTRLNAAEAELRVTQKVIAEVGKAIEHYRPHQFRLTSHLELTIPQANIFLKQKIAELELYVQHSFLGGIP